MTYKTHLIGGAQAGVLLAYMNNGTVIESAMLISTAMLGSVLPDIDHTKSKIAKNDILVGGISKGLSRITTHRGFTHTIPGALTFALLFFIMSISRTTKESVFAVLSTVVIFGVLTLLGGGYARIAGICAAAAYIGSPYILEYMTSQNISFGILPEGTSAALLAPIGMFAGCIMHMLYDSFTRGGISWLWPITKKRFRLATIRTNTGNELWFRVVQMVILLTIMYLCGERLGLFDSIADIMQDVRANDIWG